MALNVKTFLTRSASAAVFVLVFMGCLLFRYDLFSVFFLVIALIGVKEFMSLTEKLGHQPFKMPVYLFSVVIYVSWLNWPAWSIQLVRFSPYFLLALLPFVFLLFALASKTKHAFQNAIISLFAIFYAVLPMCLLHELVFPASNSPVHEFNPWILFGIVLMIWSNDTFAYLGGSFFGKRKLIERISPGKTIEGTLFGVLVTIGLSAWLPSLLPVSPPVSWLSLGILVPVAATLGDLIESLLKRSAVVKDSGQLMPGHGGVLDRFDSLILVSPAVVFLFKLSQF